jgi:hypothetical protein
MSLRADKTRRPHATTRSLCSVGRYSFWAHKFGHTLGHTRRPFRSVCSRNGRNTRQGDGFVDRRPSSMRAAGTRVLTVLRAPTGENACVVGGTEAVRARRRTTICASAASARRHSARNFANTEVPNATMTSPSVHFNATAVGTGALVDTSRIERVSSAATGPLIVSVHQEQANTLSALRRSHRSLADRSALRPLECLRQKGPRFGRARVDVDRGSQKRDRLLRTVL